jgi:hypothetical protein
MKIKSLSRQPSVLVALCLSAIISFVALAQMGIRTLSSEPSTPEGAVAAGGVCGGPGGLDQPPILTIGHGAFIGPDGKEIAPDREFIVSAQNYYINSLLRQAGTGRQRGKLTVSEAQKLIYSMVEEEVLANALFIDWLVENVQPANAANLTSINEALRWHYLDQVQRTPSKDA